MTTSRLFPATNGPASPVSYSGNFLCGVLFKVTEGGKWLNGYYKWVATGGDTVARKFALWQITGTSTATLVTAATVTSGTLTAGQWNFVPLSAPVPLAIGTAYCACTGWTAVHGFEDSDTGGAGTGAGDSFGTGGHTAGITSGPLFAFSDGPGASGTRFEPYTSTQGVFSVAGTDPAATRPNAGSNSGNFWMDVQVSDTDPADFPGPFRLYPNKADTNPATVADLNVNYSVATEFELSQPCLLGKIWFYSPAGTAQLPTSARIWTITGPDAGTSVVTQTSPTWSGAAGSGWISCSFSGVTLPAGSYKVSAYNGQASPDGWSAKDASTNYWDTGDGAAGITWGPLSAPGLSAASASYEFDGAAGGATPKFTTGVTEPGQCTFVNGDGDFFPYLYVTGLAQNYWLDVEVTPVTSGAATLAGAGSLAGSGAPARVAVLDGTGALDGGGGQRVAGTVLGGAAQLRSSVVQRPTGTALAAHGSLAATSGQRLTDITVAAGPTVSHARLARAGPSASRAQAAAGAATASRARATAAGGTQGDGKSAGPTTSNRSR